MKGIYLFSGFANHKNYDLDYCDNNIKSAANLICNVEDIDLNKYDYFLASPPCNFWSRALGSRKPSIYAENTKHLLLWSINELSKYNKPLIIENVRNFKKFDEYGIIEAANKNGLFIQFVGRHTYFTNLFIDLHIYQDFDFKHGGNRLKSKKKCIGGDNVYNVFEIFLNYINKEYFNA